MQRIRIELSIEQASAVRDALDLFTRLGIGQIQELTSIIKNGLVPAASYGGTGNRRMVSDAHFDELEDLVFRIKEIIGHPRNGSHGIGHPHNAPAVSRAYEVNKVIDKVLAELNDPNPAFRGVNYDGLTVRYTDDPPPVAVALD